MAHENELVHVLLLHGLCFTQVALFLIMTNIERISRTRESCKTSLVISKIKEGHIATATVDENQSIL